MIKTKNIYDPPEAGDGVRVLVMRLWPRGVRKALIHSWIKGLGPAPELIGGLKSDAITWTEFRKAYLSEYADEEKKAALAELKSIIRASKDKDVTLLCGCRDEGRCHRGLIKALLVRG